MRSYNFCQIECAFFGLEMQWEICYYKPKLRGLGKGRQDETDCTDLYERTVDESSCK